VASMNPGWLPRRAIVSGQPASRTRRVASIAFLVASLGMALLTTPVLTGSALAAHTPCGTPHDFFDGYDSSYVVQTTWGTSANIVNKEAATCGGVSTVSNFTIGWSMIAENPGNKGYAQSGFFHWPGNALQSFAEDNLHGGNCCFRRVFGSNVTNGGQDRYWEDYLFAPTQRWVSENVDNTALQHTNFNPVGTWAQPFVSEWNGETIYVETDMPGFSNAFSRFSVLQYEDGNGNFQTQLPAGLITTINPAMTCSCYHQDTPAPQVGLGTVFDIWTQPVNR